MISCYCHENLSEGIALLRHAASHDHLPSAYALALVLRDSRRAESDRCLARASSLGHAPSWQERLTAVEMRARFGDMDARRLSRYLDPPCLSDLLGRHYLGCRRARVRQTSHCWNPMCGRWAYKAPRAEGGDEEEEEDDNNNDDDYDNNDENGARRRAGIVGRRAVRNERVGIVRDDGIDARRRPLGARRGILEPVNRDDVAAAVGNGGDDRTFAFSIESLLNDLPGGTSSGNGTDPPPPSEPSPREKLLRALRNKSESSERELKVSRMKMCSSCRRAKYCSKLCQVYDWRSGKHKMECQFL